MCGIVGAVARREVSAILIEGLKRLEYRGYDSAGMAVIDVEGAIHTHRRVGKVAMLAEAQQQQPLRGHTGIAHTRWATHGKPSEANAHPHCSGGKSGGSGQLALVHNGIIENHEALREQLQGLGYQFQSQTDTETIVHLLHHLMQSEGLDLLAAVMLRSNNCTAHTVLPSSTLANRKRSSARAAAARWCSASVSARTSSPPISWRCAR